MAYDCFRSYLSGRSQYVSYGDYNSTVGYISCGVPQGSILGPLLFLLYVNDVYRVSENILPILFANNTTVVYLLKVQMLMMQLE